MRGEEESVEKPLASCSLKNGSPYRNAHRHTAKGINVRSVISSSVTECDSLGSVSVCVAVGGAVRGER